MRLKSRLNAMERKSRADDQLIIAFKCLNNDGIIQCSVRRDDCPQFPCKRNGPCWWNQANPNAKTIRVTKPVV